MKTLKFAFEINWTLVASACIVVWFLKYVSVKRHGPIVLLQDHKRLCTKWSKRAPSQIMWLTSDIKKSSPFFLLHWLQVHNGVKIIPKFLCSFICCFTNYSWNFLAMNAKIYEESSTNIKFDYWKCISNVSSVVEF